MSEERCGYVTGRAEDGPCETCGHDTDDHAAAAISSRRTDFCIICNRADGLEVALHTFLGRPVALCGHEEREHRLEANNNHAVCFLGLDEGGPIDETFSQPCWHPYMPARLCETCGGSA